MKTITQLGQLTVVPNKDRRFGADPEYIHLAVLDRTGEGHDILLTKEAFHQAKDRAGRNPEDLPRVPTVHVTIPGMLPWWLLIVALLFILGMLLRR